MKNFDNYLFRCSALGNIVTKSGKLTDGAKTYLLECFIGEIYGVKKEAYGKALEKGVACEQDGFKMLNDALYPERFIAKIDAPISNEYIKGTPDCVPDKVWDIKNAFDRFSFGKAELTHNYEWQLKGYCMLLGKSEGAVFYCLNNMPEHMLQDAERIMFYQRREWATMDAPEYMEACDELRAIHTYDNIPVFERFKIFPVEFTDEDSQRIIAAVEMGRKHMNELLDQHYAWAASNMALIEKAKVVTV